MAPDNRVFGSQRIVYDKLVTYAAQRIDFYMLNIDIVGQMYPAMNIREVVLDEDSLKLEFFKQVFKKCKHVHFLSVDVHDLSGRDEIKGIMELIIHNLLNKLEVLSITEDCVTSAAPPDVNSNALTVLINVLEVLLVTWKSQRYCRQGMISSRGILKSTL